jgi:outer membrane protein assembly factor BamB
MGAAAVGLSGCFWPMPGAGPLRQSSNDAERVIREERIGWLEREWTARVQGGAVQDPVTSAGLVHVADDRAVYGIDPETGRRRWTYRPSNSGGMEQPYVTGGEVWASARSATDDTPGRAVALDADTGRTTRRLTPDKALAALDDEHAAFWGMSFTSTIDVLDRRTNEWVCCDGLLFGAAGERERWPVTLGDNAIFDAGYGITSTTTDDIGNGVRRYTIDDPQPCSFLPQGMCPQWVTPINGTTATVPVLSGDQSRVYVGTDAGSVYALDAATGEIEWRVDTGSPVTDSPALVGDGTSLPSLVVPTEAGVFGALDACGVRVCPPLWSSPTDSPVSQQPAVAGNVAFVGTADGTVVGYSAGGCGRLACQPIWSDDVGSAITGAPAVSDGRLYVGTSDGRLVAYGVRRPG